MKISTHQPAPPIEEAVAYIQHLDRQHRLSFALSVGRWLHERCFVAASAPRGAGAGRASIAAIAADSRICDLRLSRGTLHNFVRVYVQLLRATPELRAALEDLSLSHQVRLLCLSQHTDKRHFAQRAVAESWSVRRLQEAVTAEMALERRATGHERPGRRPLPVAVKRSRAVVRAVDALLTDQPDLHSLSGEERASLAERLNTLSAALVAARPAGETEETS